jgi:hypothetical protein
VYIKNYKEKSCDPQSNRTTRLSGQSPASYSGDPSMDLEVLSKTNQDSVRLARNSRPVPRTYESEALLFEPLYLSTYLPSFPMSTKLYVLQ